jgi:hypothetical protein
MERSGMRLVAVLLAAGLTAGAADRVVFTKSFPGSQPAYVRIVVERDGSASYAEAADDDNPVLFRLSDAETNTFFDLAAKLNHFSDHLESGLKIANMGKKTFRWEGEGGAKEQSFNYSEVAEAKELLDWFEKTSQTEQVFIELEHAVRFDKLGVNQAVVHLEMARNQNKAVAQSQFLPLLDKVVVNEAFMHMARDRAATLAEAIRAGK